MIKNLFKSLLYFLILLFILICIYTIFIYFNFLYDNSYIKFIITLICVFISSFVLGRNSIKNGYIEGIKLGGVIVFFFFFISLIISNFKYRSLLYYLIIILVSTFGSMFGINIKKRAN